MKSARVTALEIKTDEHGTGLSVEDAPPDGIRLAVRLARDQNGILWTSFDTLDADGVRRLWRWLGVWLRDHDTRADQAPGRT